MKKILIILFLSVIFFGCKTLCPPCDDEGYDKYLQKQDSLSQIKNEKPSGQGDTLKIYQEPAQMDWQLDRELKVWRQRYEAGLIALKAKENNRIKAEHGYGQGSGFKVQDTNSIKQKIELRKNEYRDLFDRKCKNLENSDPDLLRIQGSILELNILLQEEKNKTNK